MMFEGGDGIVLPIRMGKGKKTRCVAKTGVVVVVFRFGGVFVCTFQFFHFVPIDTIGVRVRT